MQEVPCTYRISVKALVRDGQGRLLLIREASGAWELPGGGLEHGEDPRHGLSREVTEETGYTVDWMSDQPEAFWTIHKEVGSPTLKWFAFVAYGARVSGEFRQGTDGEGEEAKYFTTEEARALPLHDNTKPYFDNLAK